MADAQGAKEIVPKEIVPNEILQRKTVQRKMVFVGGMAITALLLFYFVRMVVTVDASNDLTVYLEAARAVRLGENPYLGGRTTHYEGDFETGGFWRKSAERRPSGSRSSSCSE